MNKKQNAATPRTRRWIIEALLDLMSENEYQVITVKEIIEIAGISRQTFYRHYSTKDDVLKNYFDELYQGVSKQIEKLEIKDFYHITCLYFKFWKEHSDFLHILSTSGCEYILLQEYILLMSESLDNMRTEFEDYSDQEFDYIKSLLIGGFSSIKYKWMKNNFNESPEKLAETITRLIN